MKLSKSKRKTLKAIRKRIEILQAQAKEQVGILSVSRSTRADAFVERHELQQVDRLGCRVDFKAIFGRSPTGSESAAFSRTVRLLEVDGLVIRDRSDRGTRFVRLSELGFELIGAEN